ncbi:DUF4124 domain-containing protein [Microbulbifer sp. Q7]|uniref:DUF4124 domain-containing protein n=1 Tax=Microbulbifer sp. Q7 TaxID=1785091 RepID=UPI000835D4FD|nr:DUF4124 domain-containing protein [Microbulbifer sp. Q7]
MNRWIAALALTLAVPVLAQQDSGASENQKDSAPGSVYKIVGPDGRITFSDSPPPDGKAEKVEIGPINVQPIAPRQPLPTRRLSPRDRDENRAGDDTGPVNFSIVSPVNGATIPPGQRFIVLQVALDPVPRDGYEFFVVVDGQRWSGSSSGTSLDISALERGAHTIQAVLLGSRGQPLARSQAIEVYVKRPGGQVPDFPAGQAPAMPKAQQAPGFTPKPKR